MDTDDRVVFVMCFVCVQFGATPVYIASENGHVDVVKVLHALGADVNTADEVRVYRVFRASSLCCMHMSMQ